MDLHLVYIYKSAAVVVCNSVFIVPYIMNVRICRLTNLCLSERFEAFFKLFFLSCFLSCDVVYVGPAGTGKTESVKALGHQLGRFVLVFNCDEKFDFQVQKFTCVVCVGVRDSDEMKIAPFHEIL